MVQRRANPSAAALRTVRHSGEPAVIRPSGSSITSGSKSSTPAPSIMCVARQSWVCSRTCVSGGMISIPAPMAA